MLGALYAWGAMILSPHYADRQLGTMVLFDLCDFIHGRENRKQQEGKYYFWMFYGCAVLIWLRGMYFWWNTWDYARGWIK